MATNIKKMSTDAEVKQEVQAEANAKEEAKVYNFTSDNKFLTCSALGVQFMDGKASTTNLEVAKALAKIDGVKLVEG